LGRRGFIRAQRSGTTVLLLDTNGHVKTVVLIPLGIGYCYADATFMSSANASESVIAFQVPTVPIGHDVIFNRFGLGPVAVFRPVPDLRSAPLFGEFAYDIVSHWAHLVYGGQETFF
jgi:hypothetical protein